MTVVSRVLTTGVLTGGGGPAPTPPLYSLTPFSCPVGVSVGMAVQCDAPDHVIPADADDGSGRPVLGFVVSKPDATHAVLQYSGECPVFVGLTANATYYLSTTPGVISATPPGVPGDIIEKLGVARNATTLVINICLVQVVAPTP